MSAAAIAETLAKELSITPEHAQRVYELLLAGRKPPYLARFRRGETGDLTDGGIRRFERRLKQFEELEKRRATLLRSIEEHARARSEAPVIPPEVLACMDRFELEDHFLPYRRPEPEVQLAIDRGLTPLADALVAPAPRGSNVVADGGDTAGGDTDQGNTDQDNPYEGVAPEGAVDEGVPEAANDATERAESAGIEGSAASDPGVETAPVEELQESVASNDAHAEEAPSAESDAAAASEAVAPRTAFHPAHIDLSLQLARLCAQYVAPDRGVHTEQQALEGAVRILSDRLGRNPQLRTLLRRLLRKHGRVGVRALVDDGRLGRNRSLLKLNAPLRQLQGNRLIALRQAQAQRQVALHLTVEESIVLPQVRNALGRRIHPDYASVAQEVARQALHLRLLPMIEDDVRNELRDRADEEALRLVAQHLRQILMTPPAGPKPVAGVHVDAKGDWLIHVVGPEGEPQGQEIRLEASTLTPADLAPKLNEAMRGTGVGALAVAHGKESRPALQKMRETLQILQVEAVVIPVNEAGLSAYANSELAREELGTFSVPAREAISLARRFQDPLTEFLKVDPRHLGLGREQAVIGKAALRRVVHDTIEACVAHVGCDLNRAPPHFLRHVPGLNFELAKKLVERRNARPFGSREELRTENVLDDSTWIDAIGFLRVRDSSEPLDCTALHPEQYDLARRIILQGGASVEETLGQRDAARGLRRADFDVDEGTWRDLVREISHPGRDPRPRQFVPRLLPPDSDPKTLAKDQVVEGIVSNVASFGVFVDLGTTRDAMVHVSEISHHYVRDARVLLSVGQVVRARVTDASGPRAELSLKNVPDFRRAPGPRRERAATGEARPEGEARERRGRGGSRGERQSTEPWSDQRPVLRAARSRRDGLVTGGEGRKRGGGARAGRDGVAAGGRGGGRGGRQRPEGGKDEYDADAVRRASRGAGTYNPFASFFRSSKPEDVPAPDESAAPPEAQA